MTILAADLFLLIRARHGHYCAMSTLGGRLGGAALRALGARAGEVAAIYFIDTCAADGIAVATGLVPVVENAGRHRLELRGSDGCGVAAELTEAALERAAACRKRLDAGEDADAVLAGLRTGPLEELVAVTMLAADGGDNA